MKLQQQERNSKEVFFSTLSNPIMDSAAINAMAAKNAAAIATIDKITYYHFRQVRAMLLPAQQQQFDAVIQNTLRMMKPPSGAMNDGPPPGPGHGESPPPVP